MSAPFKATAGLTLGLITLFSAAVSIRPLVPSSGAEPTAQAFTLENFESYLVGAFPDRWRMSKKDARQIYTIKTEMGNRFLRARSENQGIQIGLEYVFEPKKYNQLAWRWRAREFPPDADERKGDKHDAAAQVYVIFDNQIWPRVIKYIWSGLLPVGARFTHPLYGRGRVVVMRSGAAEKERWFEEKINFYDDY